MDNDKTPPTNLADEDFVDWTVLQHCWPDYLVFKHDEEGKPQVIFLIQRSRSYPLAADKEAMVKLFEQLGLNVRIRLPEGLLITLQDFKQGAMVSRQSTSLARQTIYQYRSMVKQMKARLEMMAPDDPKRSALQKQITAKEWLIAESVPPPDLKKEMETAKLKEFENSGKNPFGYTEDTWKRLIEELVQYREEGKQLGPNQLRLLEWHDVQLAKLEVFRLQEHKKQDEREQIERELLAKMKERGIDVDQFTDGGDQITEGAKNGTESV